MARGVERPRAFGAANLLPSECNWSASVMPAGVTFLPVEMQRASRHAAVIVRHRHAPECRDTVQVPRGRLRGIGGFDISVHAIIATVDGRVIGQQFEVAHNDPSSTHTITRSIGGRRRTHHFGAGTRG